MDNCEDGQASVLMNVSTASNFCVYSFVCVCVCVCACPGLLITGSMMCHDMVGYWLIEFCNLFTTAIDTLLVAMALELKCIKST